MPSRRWLYVLALGGCLVASVTAHAQQPPERAPPPQSQSRPDGQLQTTPILDATLGDVKKMLADEKAANEADEQRREGREVADLTAQRQMARWALWMVCLTGVAILVNGVTIALLWFTFREARRTTAAAQDNGKAAWESVATTRRIGEAQTRAYIHVNNVSLKFDNNLCPAISLTAANTGNSPARAFQWTVDFVYLYDGEGSDLIADEGFGADNWGEDIPSGDTQKADRNCLHATLDGAVLAASQRGVVQVVATINTTFVDVFEIRISNELTYTVDLDAGLAGRRYGMVGCVSSAKETSALMKWSREQNAAADKRNNDSPKTSKP